MFFSKHSVSTSERSEMVNECRAKNHNVLENRGSEMKLNEKLYLKCTFYESSF